MTSTSAGLKPAVAARSAPRTATAPLAVFQVRAGIVETVVPTFGAVAFGASRLGLGHGGYEQDCGRERRREKACEKASHARVIASIGALLITRAG